MPFQNEVNKNTSADIPAEKADELQKDSGKYSLASDAKEKIKVPREIFSAIDKRIKELEESHKEFDDTSNFKTVYPVKLQAIEALKFIKEKLSMKTFHAFSEAVTFYGTLMSPIGHLLPSQLINFLFSGGKK